MPAKPLSSEQIADAIRLKAAFKHWQDDQKARGRPHVQDDVAELFDIGQSALSQYLNGRIPINAEALLKFAAVLGLDPAEISPSVVRREQERAMLWMRTVPQPTPRSGLVKNHAQRTRLTKVKKKA